MEGKETAHMWEYKVGNNANIANFVCENLESNAADGTSFSWYHILLLF